MKMEVKDCNYPECTKCTYNDCIMENNDIAAILKRRRYRKNKEYYIEKQRKYRKKISDNLPKCNECEFCAFVLQDKGDGYRRLCVENMRLIEQKVSNCPRWCNKRKEK